MNKGDNDRAIADFDEAIRTGFMRKGDDDKAIANDNRAIRLNPGAPEYLDAARAFLSRGVAYARKGDARRAIADFDEAIRLNPSYALAFCNRGIAKLKINDASGNEDKAKARELNASSCP
jgi:tetratricopeptide (TPR) repeat protein